MSGKTDEIKGRIKEAAGALTGNDALRDEGKTQQAVGEAKQFVEKVAETVKKTVDDITKKVTN
ncbi:MAG: CsbD family protein [Pirellulaceae bacterium]|nr:CsbD family protein [Pirellulaceae bacterium]